MSEKQKKIILVTIITIFIAIVVLIVILSFKNKIENKNFFNSDKGTNEISLEDAKKYLKDNWDNVNIDGTVQMEPLHISLNEKFSTMNEKIIHSEINNNFEGFLKKETDVLLGVIFDEEELSSALEKDMKVESYAITKEALVFYVNKENPINNLSREQIKNIYTGQEDNWLKYNGQDLSIVAFQRYDKYSSQKTLKKILGVEELIDKTYASNSWPDVLNIANFGHTYDDTINSIGFNNFTFSHKENIQDIKIINIDGIKPSEKTIIDNTYPFIDYNYLYYDSNNSKISEFCKNLKIYLESNEGQKLINDSGYISILNNTTRSKNINIRDEHDLIEEIKVYDDKNKKFYSRDKKYHLHVFDSFSDFVLYDTKYIGVQDNINFLNKLQENNFIITNLNCDDDLQYEDTGLLHLANFWCSPSADSSKIFNFKFDGFYYLDLVYDFKNNTLTLVPAKEDFVNEYLKSGFLDGYPVSQIGKSNIYLKVQSLSDIQYRELSKEAFENEIYINFK